MIITENRTLAESNLDQEPKLIEMRSRINDLAQEFKDLSEEVQVKLSTLSESCIAIKKSICYLKHTRYDKNVINFSSFFRIKIYQHRSRIGFSSCSGGCC